MNPRSIASRLWTMAKAVLLIAGAGFVGCRISGGVDMDEITTSYKGFSIRRTKIEDDSHVFVVHVASDDVKRSQTIGKVIVVSPNNYEEAITLAKR
jgi:hypothetical protein